MKFYPCLACFIIVDSLPSDLLPQTEIKPVYLMLSKIQRKVKPGWLDDTMVKGHYCFYNYNFFFHSIGPLYYINYADISKKKGVTGSRRAIYVKINDMYCHR